MVGSCIVVGLCREGSDWAHNLQRGAPLGSKAGAASRVALKKLATTRRMCLQAHNQLVQDAAVARSPVRVRKPGEAGSLALARRRMYVTGLPPQ